MLCLIRIVYGFSDTVLSCSLEEKEWVLTMLDIPDMDFQVLSSLSSLSSFNPCYHRYVYLLLILTMEDFIVFFISR